MAIAGLQNVSAFGPSFFSASSILRMRQELEGDHVVSPSYRSRQQQKQRNNPNRESISVEQGSNISESSDGTDDIHLDDNNSVVSEESSEFGDNERERVRQIVKEWMNSGTLPPSSNGLFHFDNRPGSEFQKKNAEHESNYDLRPPRKEINEDCSKTNGLATDRHEIGFVRRPMRRLCGRQTLVDLLLKAQIERKGELQHLSEQKPVSEFAHRNRIQALLRGRFLRNERSISEKRPCSVAATELDSLRQRHTVSDLREEFLSKLDPSTASSSTNNVESESSSSHENTNQLESICMNEKATGICTTSDSRTVQGNRTQHDASLQVIETEDQCLQSNENESEHEKQEVSLSFGSAEIIREQILASDTTEQEVSSTDAEHTDGCTSVKSMNATVRNESLLESEGINHGENLGFERYEQTRTNNSVDQHEDIIDRDASSVQLEEISQVSEIEMEDMDINWQDGFGNEWFHETTESDALNDQHNQIVQELDEDSWPSHDLQEPIDTWLRMSSSEEVGVGRFHSNSNYFHDDDETTQRMEIRELSSWRRVSSLLQSSFRESLEQVLQFHVDGLVIASPALTEPDEEQLNINQQSALSDAREVNQFAAPFSSIVTESNPLGNYELLLHNGNALRTNSSQISGTDWDVINELRIDMSRLQQRMNELQSMLEECVDMQIELQHCVRQELSAALNRSILTRDTPRNNMLDNESRWEHVKKGICCLCSDGNINSLLYRCGHMCTCSECAEKLVRDSGKCPMCRAPVVEAVRAYFIQ